MDTTTGRHVPFPGSRVALGGPCKTDAELFADVHRLHIESPSEIRRLFLGPFLPNPLMRPGLIPFIPDVPGLRFQAVHSLDVGEAYRLAIASEVRGPFNIAADPVLDPPQLSRIFKRPLLRVPAGLLRGAAGLTWRARLQPTPAGWIDLALGVPLMGV